MTSTYVLAVDIGTSRTAASIARIDAEGNVHTERFALGRQADSTPTAVFVADDDLLFGEAAERRGLAQPERLVREFKRRIGDDVPLVVAGRSLTPERLYARAVESVVDQVSEREGRRPDGIAVTHPTTWGSHRQGLISAALAQCELDGVVFISEPEAAAYHYEAAREVAPGETLAVYDLGGGTFDTAVLRKAGNGVFTIVAPPLGLPELGGADFDDAVLRHVIRTAGLDVAALSSADTHTRLVLAQLRRECIEAKEALSFDSEATIPVVISTDRSSVRITRAEFETMIDDAVDQTIEVLDKSLEKARVDADTLAAILLIGGSSRIPRVAQRVSEHFDRPIAIDTDPKLSIALGAARTALLRLEDDRMGLSAAPLVPYIPDTAQLEQLDAAAVANAAPARRSRLYPIAVAGGSFVVAAALILGGTLTAGAPARDVAVSAETDPTDDTAGTTPEAAAPETPAGQSAPQDGTAPPEQRKSAGPPNPRKDAASPAPHASDPTPKAPAKNAASEQEAPRSRANTEATEPAQPTSDDPADSTPTDLTPTDPPVDPTPTDPPVDPTPTDPPVDPTPTDPPVDPTPTDPPVDPTPTDPPVDPTPTDPTPADPEPEPSPSPVEPV